VLILASASPRRCRLLDEAGIEYDARPVEIDETPPPGLPPDDVPAALAERKALAAWPDADGMPVLGADTLVLLGNEILGKPVDADEARGVLRRLSGREHRVVTGVCLLDSSSGARRTRTATTFVRFRDLTDDEIERYVRSGEPFDKAGGYGIQGAAGEFVSGLRGDRDNVVGLPIRVVRELIEESA